MLRRLRRWQPASDTIEAGKSLRISHRHRFVFLAVPRTGSTTMRRVLDPFSDIRGVHYSRASRDFPFYNHISARDLKLIFERCGWDWRAYRKFCVVRNPFDRVVSLYHHRLAPPAKRERGSSALYRIRNRLTWWFFSPSSFAQFVEGIDQTRGLTKSIGHFAFTPSGETLVDDILRYERLSEDGPEYLRSLGLPAQDLELPNLNMSEGRRPHDEYYDAETRRRVAELYRFEIDHFGY